MLRIVMSMCLVFFCFFPSKGYVFINCFHKTIKITNIYTILVVVFNQSLNLYAFTIYLQNLMVQPCCAACAVTKHPDFITVFIHVKDARLVN